MDFATEYNRFPSSNNGHWFYEDKLRNTIRRDLLLDYLSVHGERLGFKKDPDHYKQHGGHYDSRMEFSNFIHSHHHPFVKNIIAKWKERLDLAFKESDGIIPRPQSNLFNPSTIPEEIQKARFVYIGRKSANKKDVSFFNPELDAETRCAMLSGFPIIVNPVLMLPEKKWMCSPDFLVRSDVLPFLFDKISCRLSDMACIGAPSIGLIQCHYVIVQARFISLHFNQSDQSINDFTLRNVGNVLLYKAMLYYQSVILEQVQGFRPKYGFIMGRSCEWSQTDYTLDETIADEINLEEQEQEEREEVTDEEQDHLNQEQVEQKQHKMMDCDQNTSLCNAQKHDDEKSKDTVVNNHSHHALCSAGHMNCREWDEQLIAARENGEIAERCIVRVIESIDHAINWWNWLYTPEAYQVSIVTSSKPSDIRLYPNMKNMESFPWQFTKKQLCKQYHEITQLYLASYKFREKCFKDKVYDLQDPRMKDMIHQHMKMSKRRDVIEKIWQHQLQSPNVIGTTTPPPVLPRQIQSTLLNWYIPRKLEWFVDFETTESLSDTFEQFPQKSAQSFIAMIGSLFVDPHSRMWNYKCFAVNELNLAEERRILDAWFEDCCQTANLYGVSNIEDKQQCAFVHWSAAECKFLDTNRMSARNRHKPYSEKWPNLPYLDMLEVVKTEPVVVQGSYSFKLKSLAKALYKLGLIDVDWPSNSQCDSGLNAMTALFLCDRDARQKQISMMELPLMKEIVEYNKIDCLSMFKITEYLRQGHKLEL